jgi:DNA-binding transcriptional regulator WhiA
MIFNLLQYLPKHTKIKLDEDLRKKLFSSKKVSEWSRQLKIPLKNMSRYKIGSRSLSLNLFKDLLKFSGLKLKDFQDKTQLKINPTGKYLRIGPFVDINESWVYVSELINGDGHIPKKFWNITFVNKDSGLIRYVKNFFISLGLNESRLTIVKNKNVNFLIIRSSLLAYIFNKILEVSVGKKEEINIPYFIIKNKKLGISAVRGAFDAEGSISFTGSRRISISSNSELWISKLNKILIGLNIKSKVYKETRGRKKPLYRLFIYHIINLRRFARIIKPLHTERSFKLNNIINEFNKNPSRIFHRKVLLSIQKRNLRRKEIAKDIKCGLVKTANNIAYLKNKKFIIPIEKIYTNKGCYFKYNITKKGLEYLKAGKSYYF